MLTANDTVPSTKKPRGAHLPDLELLLVDRSFSISSHSINWLRIALDISKVGKAGLPPLFVRF